jgi:hypothetical protein
VITGCTRFLPFSMRYMVTALEVASPFASNPQLPTIAPLARTQSSLSVTEARVPSEAATASSRTSAF